MTTPFERAVRAIEIKLEAIAFARANIQSLRDSGELDPGFANDQLEELLAREGDLAADLEQLVGTGSVTSGPSGEAVESLAGAVAALRNHNVTADNVHDVIGEVFALVAA